MPDLGSLTTGELSTTTTAAAWLVTMQNRLISSQRPGILEPAVTAELSSLLADCHAERESRTQTERAARSAAVAARKDCV
jgi:hypothetical protein